ncbi:hypothetical protein MTO96_016271 [Rhipicephalus appendiculatus]
MSRSDSEYTTTASITHTDGVYSFSTTTGTTYTTDDTRSVGFVPTAATAGPKQNVSLGQLTYIVKSSEPSAAPDKAASRGRRDEPLAERHAGKFEGQRRAAQSLPPPKLPPAAPTPEKRLPKGDGQPKTTPQEALGVARTRTAESSAAFTDPALLLAGPSSRSPIGYSTDSYFSSTADSYTSTTSTTSTYSGSDISYWESDAILYVEVVMSVILGCFFKVMLLFMCCSSAALSSENDTVPFAVIWPNADNRLRTLGSYVTRVWQEYLQLSGAECSGWSQATAFYG